MAAGIWFWIIYVIVGLFGFGYGTYSGQDRRYLGGGFLLFLLVGLLGWGVFGPPIR